MNHSPPQPGDIWSIVPPRHRLNETCPLVVLRCASPDRQSWVCHPVFDQGLLVSADDLAIETGPASPFRDAYCAVNEKLIVSVDCLGSQIDRLSADKQLEFAAIRRGERTPAQRCLALWPETLDPRVAARRELFDYYRSFIRPRARRFNWHVVVPTAAAAVLMLGIATALLIDSDLSDPITFAGPADLAHRSVRIKGSSVLEIKVQRGVEVFDFKRQPLQSGDVLALRYSSARSHLMVLSLEESGRVHVAMDSKGQSRTIQPGSAVPLKQGIALDDYAGKEWLIAVFSDGPLVTADVIGTLQKRFSESAPRFEAQLGPDIDVVTWTLQRVPSSR